MQSHQVLYTIYTAHKQYRGCMKCARVCVLVIYAFLHKYFLIHVFILGYFCTQPKMGGGI